MRHREAGWCQSHRDAAPRQAVACGVGARLLALAGACGGCGGTSGGTGGMILPAGTEAVAVVHT
ncbi:hypothetical protein MKK75_13880 [Methylobacterium sp. J-030]|uniref:hypothetical protein n=1 Tax=Methylobacterium sp. J-030 TaxID=2836627 RepID=UPI001FB95D29|nr:hypothetical protein [Methylobacterium sp. J-030]MCJ2069869.1 hypothetical protein [Methylobacterium sp. J-030]